MGSFATEDKALDNLDANKKSVGIYDNVKRFRAADGSYSFDNGVIRLRDSSGNVVIILDPNG